MSRFIKLTSPESNSVYLSPDDVKAVQFSPAAVGSEILLYGAAEVWVTVLETPAEVIALVEPPAVKAQASTAFYGRN